jgi:hypothetical protein
MAQALEYLPSKCENLTSNSVPPKNPKGIRIPYYLYSRETFGDISKIE